MGKCKGTTVENRPCKRFSVLGGDYCFSHCEKVPSTSRKKVCVDLKKVATKEPVSKKVATKKIKKPATTKKVAKPLKKDFTDVDFYELNGTSEKGEFSGVSYAYLVKQLGKPHATNIDEIGPDKFKIKAMWAFKTSKGMIFTVYDWKEYYKPVEKIKRWHIGGKNDLDLKVVGRLLGVNTTPPRVLF